MSRCQFLASRIFLSATSGLKRRIVSQYSGFRVVVPTRARGLKHTRVSLFPLRAPRGARGLKQNEWDELIKSQAVAPHAGAWIETREYARDCLDDPVASPRGRVGLKHTTQLFLGIAPHSDITGAMGLLDTLSNP
jgi:hypothetical protein